jgi:hypothetical protein
MSEALICAAHDCTCRADTEDAVSAAGQMYCSERCIDGRGCDHQGCNCGRFPTTEPEPEGTPAARHHHHA